MGELDLSPTTHNYWKLRFENPVLHNSENGMVEMIIAKALEMKKGEFRAYVWMRR